jgi:glycosyltransferase involved in cell wall biosynthesis
MNVTVILCTFNRCRSLAGTLESVAASTFSKATQWEVLVVDNNSTDQTRELTAQFCARYPGRFRYIFEPEQGKSFALNTGIREAKGDVLAFMDDDVTVEPTWLQNLTAPLEGAEWAGTGGRTLLAEAFSPPPWLSFGPPDHLGGVLAAVFDRGPAPCELSEPPFGANMAFRKEMFDKYGLFRTDLGPSPNRRIPRPNEDTEFGRRVLAAGERLRYQPSAVAYHPLLQDRVDKKYFLAWWFDYGRALMREKGRGPDIWGIPRYYLSIPMMIGKSLSVRTLRWMWAFNPQRRFSNKCWTWIMAGQIVETYRMGRAAGRLTSDPASAANVHSSSQFDMHGRT